MTEQESTPESQQESPEYGPWCDSDIERLRSMIGGKRDMVDGAAPAILFVVANAVWSLLAAAIISTVAGAAIAIYRIARKHQARHALFGLLGSCVAVGLALVTKSASAYFVPGVIIGALMGLVTLVTVAARQPTSAMLAAALEKKPAAYYQQPQVMRAHMLVTTCWAMAFLGRAGLRAYLIAIDQPELLGASALLLGYPLTLALAGGTVLYLRRLSARQTVVTEEA